VGATEAREAWQRALGQYCYQVDLTRFEDREQFPGYFAEQIPGNRDTTKDVEDPFRERAPRHLEVWYEVVFWKMFSQAGRRDKQTRAVIKRITASGLSAADLWWRCCEYVRDPSKGRLKAIARALLSEEARSIAIGATFPAFMAPERFPMVDTRVAKWATACAPCHNAADPTGPQLVLPAYPGNRTTVLTLSDWPFIESWLRWCRHTASKLRSQTDFEWRARDVEMAVFSAWGNGRALPPLSTR